MVSNKQTSVADFEKYHFSVATATDNQDIIALLKKNPIHMEMDYIMDRQDDFFKVQKIYPGSKVMIARNTTTNEIVGCLSLLKLEGMIAGEKITYQYITDLVKSGQEQSPLLMKKLLNYTFENHFDTDFLFGLINAANKSARFFSTSDVLHYRGKVLAKFHYSEIIPLSLHRIPQRFEIRFPATAEAQIIALNFINNHYKNHLLFLPLDLLFLKKMFVELPNFSYQNIAMLYEAGILKGVMMLYNPAEVVSVIIARMDRKTKILLGLIKAIHRTTGLLFSPPGEGGQIKTLQVRYLAGTKETQSVLLRYANNFAYQHQLHSVSMLVDERDAIKADNAVVYQYQSLMYAGFKTVFLSKTNYFKDMPVFFDITFS